MNTRVIVAAIAGAFAMFLLGWVIWGVALKGYFDAQMIHYDGLTNDPPAFLPLTLAQLAWGWLFAYILDRWNVNDFISGLKAGAILIVPISIASDLQMKAFMNISHGYFPTVIDVLAALVMGTLSGGIIGLVLGMMAKRTPVAA